MVSHLFFSVQFSFYNKQNCWTHSSFKQLYNPHFRHFPANEHNKKKLSDSFRKKMVSHSFFQRNLKLSFCSSPRQSIWKKKNLSTYLSAFISVWKESIQKDSRVLFKGLRTRCMLFCFSYFPWISMHISVRKSRFIIHEPEGRSEWVLCSMTLVILWVIRTRFFSKYVYVGLFCVGISTNALPI